MKICLNWSIKTFPPILLFYFKTIVAGNPLHVFIRCALSDSSFSLSLSLSLSLSRFALSLSLSFLSLSLLYYSCASIPSLPPWCIYYFTLSHPTMPSSVPCLLFLLSSPLSHLFLIFFLFCLSPTAADLLWSKVNLCFDFFTSDHSGNSWPWLAFCNRWQDVAIHLTRFQIGFHLASITIRDFK